MDNISEIPYKERGLAIVVENPVRQVSSSRMGMFRRKKGALGSPRVIRRCGVSHGGILKVSLRDPRVCESLPIFDASKQKKRSEAKRSKMERRGSTFKFQD